MKQLLPLVLILLIYGNSLSQSCQQNLEDANRAYYSSGQLQSINDLLENCLDSYDKIDRFEALKLLVNSNLLRNEDEKADQYMAELLKLRPEYKVRESDLAEFKALYETYKLKTRFTYGISGGVVRPDYVILHQHSYSGQTEQVSDYEEIPGFSIGLTGDYNIWNYFYINLGILYAKRSFKQEEIQMGFRRVRSTERDFYLDIPIQLKYVINTPVVKPYIAGGYAMHYLLKAEADIDHWPVESQFIANNGVPNSVESFNLTDQRARLSHNWTVSAGIQYPFSKFMVDLQFSYQRGLTNQIESRYGNVVLEDTYAYVPDDYKVNSFKLSLILVRNVLVPVKK